MKYITVCKNTILSNLKHGTNKPTIRVSDGKYGKPKRVHKFPFNAKGCIVCDMNNPLPWGARVWIEIDETK
jgi:hypothetical protein